MIDATDRGWMIKASCRDEDPELFFPGTSQKVRAAAVAVCRRCPVTRECAAYALSTRSTHGVWGSVVLGERTDDGPRNRSKLEAVL